VPSGARCITPGDLVVHLGSTESWWTRQRPAMIRAGLLTKVGRRFFGDLTAIQAALAAGSDWNTQTGG
jgi:hypothetical protein